MCFSQVLIVLFTDKASLYKIVSSSDQGAHIQPQKQLVVQPEMNRISLTPEMCWHHNEVLTRGVHVVWCRAPVCVWRRLVLIMRLQSRTRSTLHCSRASR